MLEVIGMLQPRSIDWRGVRGGTPSITTMDIAHAMGGLTKQQTAVVRAKYAEDASVLAELVWHMLVATSAIAELQELNASKRLKRGQLPGMIFLAIKEVVEPSLCGACSGRSVIYKKNGLVESCQSCRGSWRKAMSKAAQLRYMNELIPEYVKGGEPIGKDMWDRYLHKAYLTHVYDLLATWEQQAMTFFKNRMR